VVPVLVCILIFNQQEHILGVEDAGTVLNRYAAKIESGRSGITNYESIRVVVHRNLAGQISQRVFELNQSDRGGVTDGNVEEDWQDFLFEEPGVELKAQEHG